MGGMSKHQADASLDHQHIIKMLKPRVTRPRRCDFASSTMSLGNLAPFVAKLHEHTAARGLKTCFLLNGGVHAHSWLLSVGGASASVLELVTAYSPQSLEHYLGARPEVRMCEENDLLPCLG